MQPFNLAESRMLERRYCRQYVDKKAKGIVVLVVAAVLVFFGSCWARTVVCDESSRITRKLSAMQTECSRARARIAEAKTRIRRQAWHAQLVGGTNRRTDALNAILQCAPDGIWISRIQSDDKDARINIDGSASSPELVSLMTGSLRRMPWFTDVRISGIRSAGLEGIESVSFSIQLQMPTATPGDGTAKPSGVPKIVRDLREAL